MPIALGRGLVDVPTAPLQVLFRALCRDELKCPPDAWEFARFGLQSWQAELGDALRGLDRPGVRAVLVAVLAERNSTSG
ncbi:MAG: hypothetical protein EXR71_02930 [Myxococcales bacterium]|nr:hypothetical protein [Myxococcales bacterium]